MSSAWGCAARLMPRIWAYAKEHEYTIVSKDSDLRQQAFLHGPPPKVIWLSVGNAGTAAIARLIQSRIEAIRKFDADPEQSLLILEAKVARREP